MRIVSDEKMDKAVNYLVDHDAKAAELMAEVERTELLAKALKDALIKHGDGSLGDRTASAGSDPTYIAAMEKHFVALQEYNTVKNRRSTAAMICDIWRTEESSRRKGNV